MRRIQVAAAIVVDGDSLLLVHQQVDGLKYWSLPGGVVEDGETLLQALERELLEETGLRMGSGIELAHVTELATPEFISLACVYLVTDWTIAEGAPASDPAGEVFTSEFASLDVARKRLSELPWPSMREPILEYLDGTAGAFYSYQAAADDWTTARRVSP